MIQFAEKQNYTIEADKANIKAVETSINNDTFSRVINIKNIILYGVPRVGKTHNYKKLISMIEEGEDEKTIFEAIAENKSTNNFDDSIFSEANIRWKNRICMFSSKVILMKILLKD